MPIKVNIKDVRELGTVLDTKLEVISKDMVEDVLTGVITSHSHNDDAGGTVTSITLNATSPILIDDSNAITISGTRTFSHASTSGNKHIPSGGSADNYLKWDSDGTATWSVLPTASTSVAGITTVGASGGAASYVHTHVKSDITDFDHNHDTLYLGLTATAANSDKLDGKDSTDFSLAGHGHGYINGDGTITTNATIANGDRILIADSDDEFKLKRTSIEFNTANGKFLREDGSWSDIPVATTSVDGLMTNTDKIKVNQLDLDSVLGNAVSSSPDPDCLTVLDASDSYKMKRGPEFQGVSTWYLSSNGTWESLRYRAIQFNGTGHVGPAVNNALNFVDGANTTMSVTSNVGVTSIQVNCNPTSYLHNHRLLFSGKVSINPGTESGTYTAGLRIGNSSQDNSLIALGTDGSSLGVNNDGKQWHIMKLSTGELILTYDDSVNSGLTLEKNGSIKWRGAPLVVGSRIVSGVTSSTMEFNPEANNNFDIVLGENSKYIMPVHDPSMLVSKDIVINLSTLGSVSDFSESEVTLEVPFVMHGNGDINIIFESGSLNIFYSENFRLISELEGNGTMLYRIRYIEQMNRWSISSELFII